MGVIYVVRVRVRWREEISPLSLPLSLEEWAELVDLDCNSGYCCGAPMRFISTWIGYYSTCENSDDTLTGWSSGCCWFECYQNNVKKAKLIAADIAAAVVGRGG